MRLRDVVTRVCDRKGGAVLEGMLEKSHGKKAAPKHPNISFGVHFVLEKGIAHFWCSICDGGPALEDSHFGFMLISRQLARN